MNTPSTTVSPGILGFIFFFALAIALWLLVRNMNSRLRRMQYREEEAGRAEGSGTPGAPTAPGDGPDAPAAGPDAPAAGNGRAQTRSVPGGGRPSRPGASPDHDPSGD